MSYPKVAPIAKLASISGLFAFMLFLSGCSSFVTTNKVAEIPAPQIGITTVVANFSVKEPVTGEACATDYFSIFGAGPSRFLEAYGDGDSSALGRAKAAAAFNALNKDALTTDILVASVFEIKRDETPISDNYCVLVKGFRGVIEGFRPDNHVTRSSSKPKKAKKRGFISGLIPSVSFDNSHQSTDETSQAVLPKQDINVNIRVQDCGKKKNC